MGLQSRYGATIQPTSPFCLPPSASIVHGPYFVKVYKGLRSYRFPLRVSRFARDSSPRSSQTAYLFSASFSSSQQPKPFSSSFLNLIRLHSARAATYMCALCHSGRSDHLPSIWCRYLCDILTLLSTPDVSEAAHWPELSL